MVVIKELSHRTRRRRNCEIPRQGLRSGHGRGVRDARREGLQHGGLVLRHRPRDEGEDPLLPRLPVSRQTLVFDGRVMEDDRDTEHYGVLHGSRIRLFLEPPCRPTAAKAEECVAGAEVCSVARAFPAAAAAPQSKRLRLVVALPQTQWGAASSKKVAVEVNGADNVSELRKELQRLQGKLCFDLPMEGYFFIYKQNVMDEDRTFRWHDVRQGDTIEIFNRGVTSG